MYLIRGIRFGSWKVRRLNRALVTKPTNIQASRCGQLRFTTDLQVELRKLSETKLRSRIFLLHRNRITVFSGQKSTKMSRPTDPYDTSAQRSEPRLTLHAWPVISSFGAVTVQTATLRRTKTHDHLKSLWLCWTFWVNKLAETSWHRLILKYCYFKFPRGN